jgi:hypothetical protein
VLEIPDVTPFEVDVPDVCDTPRAVDVEWLAFTPSETDWFTPSVAV